MRMKRNGLSMRIGMLMLTSCILALVMGCAEERHVEYVPTYQAQPAYTASPAVPAGPVYTYPPQTAYATPPVQPADASAAAVAPQAAPPAPPPTNAVVVAQAPPPPQVESGPRGSELRLCLGAWLLVRRCGRCLVLGRRSLRRGPASSRHLGRRPLGKVWSWLHLGWWTLALSPISASLSLTCSNRAKSWCS
jgi:hypothetical protein